jgi:hypothetical protein
MSKVESWIFTNSKEPKKTNQLGHLCRGQFDVVFGLVSKLLGEMVGAENLQWSAQPSNTPQNFDSLLKKVLCMFWIT